MVDPDVYQHSTTYSNHLSNHFSLPFPPIVFSTSVHSHRSPFTRVTRTFNHRPFRKVCVRKVNTVLPTMFRNQYDTDPTTFSPQGRLFQVEYAAEAVKQGSCCVGIRSNTHAVLGVIKRSPDELAAYQEKLFKMDSHMVVAISGLTADARYLGDHMRMECLNHKFVYGANIQVGRLISTISDMHQRCTQDMTYERGRPFGVGLLVAGFDKTGPHIYETSPTGHYYEHKAQAIGSRSQSARTYMEKVFESFPDLSVDDLVVHTLKSLEGAAGDKDITAASVGIAIVGEGMDEMKMLDETELKRYLALCFGSEEGKKAGEDDAAAEPAAPEDVEMSA